MNKTIQQHWEDGTLVGKTVRLIHHKRISSAYRKVKALYKDIDGGVILDTSIEDFRSWNISDLEIVEDQ